MAVSLQGEDERERERERVERSLQKANAFLPSADPVVAGSSSTGLYDMKFGVNLSVNNGSVSQALAFNPKNNDNDHEEYEVLPSSAEMISALVNDNESDAEF